MVAKGVPTKALQSRDVEEGMLEWVWHFVGKPEGKDNGQIGLTEEGSFKNGFDFGWKGSLQAVEL